MTKKLTVLLVGSGGREHALAWKIAQSPRLEKLICVPGNPGMADYGECVDISVDDLEKITLLAQERRVDLAIIGPEAPLASGLTDRLRFAGVAVFGPNRMAAELESSKAFAKAFMERHHIPTARYVTVTGLEEGMRALEGFPGKVVLKTSGLAAGKGVLLPETREETEEGLRKLLVERIFGSAGDEVVIEERLEGEEVSLLAFSDGRTVRLMPPAQDHKRIGDNDTGPNTGGMGAFAPAGICPPELGETILNTVIRPAIQGMRREGRPYKGVLYAGVILTPGGPKTLEFNCRFGDPETQVLLPLLESDLLEVCLACANGTLHDLDVQWKPGSAVCVVMAAAGYPGKYEKGQEISGLDSLPADCAVFQAGTVLTAGRLVSSGGRVLGVTAWGGDLPAALEKAYGAVRNIQFNGAQYRRDIAQKGLRRMNAATGTYAGAGVNIDAGNEAVRRMAPAVKSTYNEHVLGGIGAFGGLFSAQSLAGLHDPVLVASTDGVGTKVKLAASLGRYAGVGRDIVGHCVNDILVQGAKPLFFLDYIASSKLKPEMVAEVVEGIAAACRENGIALLGGETAEMPDVYLPGEFDIAGTIVGAVSRERILPRGDLAAGDALVGLRSSGPHTNGYSLLRKVFAEDDKSERIGDLGMSLGEALLAPHRSYLPLLYPILSGQPGMVKALAHLTGGGFIENIPRVLPEGLQARVKMGSWPVPPLFKLAQQRGRIAEQEMMRVFNMGIGMVAVVGAGEVKPFQELVGEDTWVIGELVAGPRGTVLA